MKQDKGKGKEKAVVAPKKRKSEGGLSIHKYRPPLSKRTGNANEAKNGNESSDDDDNVTVAASKQAKKPKIGGLPLARSLDRRIFKAQYFSFLLTEKAKTASSSAVKPASNANAGGDGLVSFKNNKLIVKQKKLDLANRNEYLQSMHINQHNLVLCPCTSSLPLCTERMAWNQFLEDVQDPLEEVPEEHYPLIALLVQES